MDDLALAPAKRGGRMTHLNRIILTTLAVIIVVFALMIAIVANILFAHSIERAKEAEIDAARLITDAIRSEFDSMSRLLQMTQKSLAGLDLKSQTADDAAGNMLLTLLDLSPNAHGAWFVFEKGRYHADRYYIREFINDGGFISENLSSSIGEKLKAVESAPWYYSPFNSGETYFDAVNSYDYNLGGSIVNIAMISVPIVAGGEIIGVCGVDIRYSDILELINEIYKKQNSSVMLLSQDLTILHARDRSLIDKNLADFNFEDIDNVRSVIAQASFYSGEIVSPFIDEKAFICLQPIPVSIGTEQQFLYLRTGVALSGLYADSYRVIMSLVIAGFITLLLIIAILFFNANKVVQPIRTLARQAQQVAAGDHTIDIFASPHEDPRDKSETAVLRRAFNEMLRALQNNILTVEKRVEERTLDLKRLNNYVTLLMNSTASYSLLLDRDTKVLYCSYSLNDLLGIEDTAPFIGMPLLETYGVLFKDADFVAAARQRLGRAIAGENFVQDDTVVWPSGKKRIYRITYKGITDEHNDLDGIIVAANDITDLRFEESQRRVNDMLYSTLLPCLVWDEKGQVVAYNKEASKAFGAPEQLSPAQFHEFFLSIQPPHQPDGRRTEDIRQQVILDTVKKGFAQVTICLERNDGTPMYFMVNAFPVSWMFEYRLIVYYHDMTDIISKEAEAKEAEERVKLMLDSNPLMCILRDDKGNIVDCNQAALNVLGVPDKAVFCRDYYSYFPEYQPDGSRSDERTVEIMQILDEQGHLTLERTFLTPAGELIPVDTTIVKMPWKDKYYYLSYSQDLREIKANEQKMREIAARERAALLQTEAAQAANEAKSQFLASVSHEIRTPMNAVLGMSELLLHEKLSKRQYRYVSDIKTSAIALLDIINDILDVSKIQAGKFDLMPAHYDFNMMIDNVNSIAQFLVEEKNISFRLAMPEEAHLCLYGDAVRLRQVLLNLISNAVKFTEKGYVKLAVSFSGATIKITVSDTGIGIPPESLPTLFDAFEQADVERNRDKKGTGLGLTISKAIVEMMGGRITVESVYGQGSSFSVEIPKVLGDEALIYQGESQKIEIYAPEAKVLVVDDNLINLHVATGILQLCQITADTATSGKQAIEMIQQEQYDIVFMDQMMPVMNGSEATRIIREMGMTVPIIALTASASVGAKEKMLEAGMDDYLSKPIINAELKQMLKQWIPAHKQLTMPSQSPAAGEAADEADMEVWRGIEQIEGLSLAAGLDRVDGRHEVYQKTLKLMIREIEKTQTNLREFLAAQDMENFRVEVHGMKGALANIGAMNLSAKAFELESASAKGDAAFCAANLPDFLDKLNGLQAGLLAAFAQAPHSSGGRAEIPAELPEIFRRMLAAFAEIDLVLIDQEVENLNALKLSGALKEEIEQIKDLVMMMDYNGATEHINKLLD